MGLFWRRKKDEFVSLRLNEPAAAAPETPAPPVAPPPIETVKQEEPPQKTVKPEPVAPTRSPFQSSVLGLNLSMEELTMCILTVDISVETPS